MAEKQQDRVSRKAATKAGVLLSASDELDAVSLATAQAWRVQHLEPTARCFEALTQCASSVPHSGVTVGGRPV